MHNSNSSIQFWVGFSSIMFEQYLMYRCVVQQLSCMCLFVTPCDPKGAHQAPSSVEFSRQYWSGLPFSTPRDLTDPGSNPGLLHLLHQQAGSLLPCYLGRLIVDRSLQKRGWHSRGGEYYGQLITSVNFNEPSLALLLKVKLSETSLSQNYSTKIF